MQHARVYLAGSLESDWQDLVISTLAKFDFYDPRAHRLQDKKQYTMWDFHYIRQCQILFAYMGKDNPSGYGLSVELGYAKGMGKTIILVDERSLVDEKFSEYFAIVREAADIVFDSLQEGITFLQSFMAEVNY